MMMIPHQTFKLLILKQESFSYVKTYRFTSTITSVREVG